MNEQELRTILWDKGIELVRVRKFKKHDRLTFRDSFATYTWSLRDGKRLEDLEPKHIHEILGE